MVRRPGILVDLTPLRRYPEFRDLWLGWVVSVLGSQLTVVAVPYEVYRETGSSLQVGLVSLASLGAVLVGSFGGGAIADHFDRRRLLLGTQVLLAATSAGLALNASLAHGSLAGIYACSAAAAALSGIGGPTRSALVVHLVDREALVAANALWQLLAQIGTVVGPSLAGLLLARVGLAALYWIDTATFAAAVVGVLRIRRGGGRAERGGLDASALLGGLRYIRANQVFQAVYLVDLNAMVFGMPRALFPALGLGRFHGGPTAVGLLYAAPGAGALLGALLTGRATRVRRQGRAVLVAVAVWGAAIALFGAVPLLALALPLLAVAGAADVVSALYRGTILQLEAPDALRGRIQAVQWAVVTGGPRLGDVEAAGVASAIGPVGSVVSGGVACLVGVAAIAWLLPGFDRYRAGRETPEQHGGGLRAGPTTTRGGRTTTEPTTPRLRRATTRTDKGEG